MSLEELSYVNLKRTDDAASRSMPPPPYNFRPHTMAQRDAVTSLPTLILTVPGREDWVFSGALAKPSLASKITRYLSGSSDRVVEYESEAESVEDEDVEMRDKKGSGSRGGSRGGTRGRPRGRSARARGSVSTRGEVRGRSRGRPGRPRGRGRGKRGTD